MGTEQPQIDEEESLLSLDDASEVEALSKVALDETSNWSNTSSTTSKKSRDQQLDKDHDELMDLEEDEDDIQEMPKVQNVSKKSTGAPQNLDKKNRPSSPSSLATTTSSVSAPSSASYQKKNSGLDSLKFMADFDPQNSSRNQQKKKKRYHPNDGRLIQYADDYENCDCLRANCPGCHYPCKSCQDPRCGHICRISRKWIYEAVEVEGRNQVFENTNSNTFKNTHINTVT